MYWPPPTTSDHGDQLWDQQQKVRREISRDKREKWSYTRVGDFYFEKVQLLSYQQSDK